MMYQGPDGKEYYFHTFIPKYRHDYDSNPRQEELQYSLNKDLSTIDLKIEIHYNSKSKLSHEIILFNKNKKGFWQDMIKKRFVYNHNGKIQNEIIEKYHTDNENQQLESKLTSINSLNENKKN
jgi:hypothetical protein